MTRICWKKFASMKSLHEGGRSNMRFALGLILIASITSIVSPIQSHCPVSSTLDLNKNGSFFYYPVDQFGPSSSESDKSSTVPCRTFDRTFPKVHLCPKIAGFCPVSKNNVHDALRQSSPLSRSSICLIHQKLLMHTETVNFYVSGGSVTLGKSADECCSARECAYDELDHVTCSWSFQLFLWMNRTFPATINYLNIADHGHSSEVMVDNLIEKFAEWEMKSFTSNDIIFLDHSVNDNEAGGASLATSFESLIRHIYFYSIPRNWPTIVVLDADPVPHKTVLDVRYSDVYERIARHYDIPIWSYRDAVLSNYSRTEQRQYSAFLTFDLNEREDEHGGTHPPWTVHWFMADLYANIWNHDTAHYCTADNAMSSKLYQENLKMRNRTFPELPSPLSVNVTIDECSNKVLNFYHKLIVTKLPVVGNFEFVPSVGGWTLGVDKPGRPGGFLVDNSSVNNARVVFSLNISTKEFVANKKELQIIIQYLRSYDNGGLVQVRFCGQKIRGSHGKFAGMLDGLWVDYKTHKYSLPDKWSPLSKVFSYKLCEKFPEAHPTIEIGYMREEKARHRGKQKFKLLSITACLV